MAFGRRQGQCCSMSMTRNWYLISAKLRTSAREHSCPVCYWYDWITWHLLITLTISNRDNAATVAMDTHSVGDGNCIVIHGLLWRLVGEGRLYVNSVVYQWSMLDVYSALRTQTLDKHTDQRDPVGDYCNVVRNQGQHHWQHHWQLSFVWNTLKWPNWKTSLGQRTNQKRLQKRQLQIRLIVLLGIHIDSPLLPNN